MYSLNPRQRICTLNHYYFGLKHFLSTALPVSVCDCFYLLIRALHIETKTSRTEVVMNIFLTMQTKYNNPFCLPSSLTLLSKPLKPETSCPTTKQPCLLKLIINSIYKHFIGLFNLCSFNFCWYSRELCDFLAWHCLVNKKEEYFGSLW